MRLRAACSVVVSLALLSAGAPVRAAPTSKEDKKACIAASEKAQQLRSDGELLAAREEMLVCAREVCPGVIRKDCAKWLGELEDALPSIVFGAKDGRGHDLEEVKVSIDGTVVTTTLDGKAIAVDPGPHVVKFEHAGSPDVEDKIVVREGEKNRFVTVKIRVPGDDVVETSTTPNASAGEGNVAPRKIPTATVVLGGVGLVALGSFVFFGLEGKSDESHLRSTCAPVCSDSDVSAVHSKYVVADVSLLVSVASLGVAAYLYYSQPRELESPKSTITSHAPAFDLRVDAHGAFAVFGGAF